ncbi:hypothetical protein V7182_24075 [Neobacillus drentensis]|uniref:hypothetical protein n=1 Tax=Neobacillus drentensis TaxID=220684 RepID=UPI003000B949
MEKQILEILKELQSGIKELQTDMKEVKTDLVEVKTDMVEVKSDIREIKGTVNRIETAQAEDVVGILKMTKKKTDFEVDYINNRLTEMDKRLFNVEKRIEN